MSGSDFPVLKRDGKYLLFVNLDEVNPVSVQGKLVEAGLSITVLAIPDLRGNVAENIFEII